jgi:hypothetical protein
LLQYLRDEEMLRAMEQCLRRILANDPSSIEINTGNVRVFVASYLFVYKKKRVLEGSGDAERTLHANAVNLLQAFDTIVDYVADKGTFVGAPFLASFRTSLTSYLNAFYAWKQPDENRLKNRIIMAIIGLTKAWMALSVDQDSDDSLRSELTAQFLRMRSELTKIKGPEGHRDLEEQLAALSLPVIDPA